MDIFKVNGYELDNYQKEVVLTNNKNVLVIAGAGSGKTLTIIGKIRYLIEILNIKKEEILCISFTNDSVNNLKNNLLNNYNYEIECYTFHKLALEILNKNNISVKIASEDYLQYIIEEYLNIIIYFKKEYENDIKKYLKYKNQNINKLKNNIHRFIKIFKCNNYDLNDMYKIMLKNKRRTKVILFLRIVLNIYLIYQNELESSNTIDFDDMINKSIKEVKNIKLNYKYIIIDEYQDTSYTRYLLIKEIMNNTNAKLLAVGDDFQSIYRFNGCNLDIFLNFDKYFNNTKILKIINTYRNSQELINIATNFITKNKYQIKKNLYSSKNIDKPVIIIYYKNQKEAFKRLIKEIDKEILILGRNNNDIYKVIDDDFELKENGKLVYKKDLNIKLRYLTVHKSKGLESENVVIINVIKDIMGFPSYIEDDKVINIINNKDKYYLEEERRLFYVSLTRTKNNVYLLTNKKKESIFIKELLKYNKKKIHIINYE